MIDIKPVDTPTAPVEDLRAIHQVLVAIEVEQLPDEAPAPFAHREAALRARPSAQREFRRWLADLDGVLAGHCWAMRWEDDPDNSLIWVGVLPEQRRRRVGRALLGTAVEALAEARSTKVIIDCIRDAPWEEALARLGLARSLTDRVSRLSFEDLDWEMIDGWIERASERAGDYHLLHLVAPIPEEHLESWCRVVDVMNTAPLEGLELARSDTTPEKWRERERVWADRGDSLEAFVAVHSPSGRFVGYTDVVFETHRPDLAHQVDTAVDPEHRDRGLGRWLKAAMVRHIAEARPEVSRVFTANVGSNQPMLAINDAMGFRPVLWQHAWQGDLGTVREALRDG
jgi:mycothiol synthase